MKTYYGRITRKEPTFLACVVLEESFGALATLKVFLSHEKYSLRECGRYTLICKEGIETPPFKKQVGFNENYVYARASSKWLMKKLFGSIEYLKATRTIEDSNLKFVEQPKPWRHTYEY